MIPAADERTGAPAPPRERLVERMDQPDAPENLLFRTLDQFRISNRLFARYRTLLSRALWPAMRADPGRTWRVTDLGAGGGDIARWLVRYAGARGLRLVVRAIECDERILRYAKQRAATGEPIAWRQADALDTEAWGDPDFVFANHLLHHLPAEQGVELLRRLDRSGVRGYVLSDIERSRRAEWAYRLVVAPVFRRSFLLEDGLLSIRRGFTVRELKGWIAEAAPRHPPRVLRLFPSRLAIVRLCDAGGRVRSPGDPSR